MSPLYLPLLLLGILCTATLVQSAEQDREETEHTLLGFDSGDYAKEWEDIELKIGGWHEVKEDSEELAPLLDTEYDEGNFLPRLCCADTRFARVQVLQESIFRLIQGSAYRVWQSEYGKMTISMKDPYSEQVLPEYRFSDFRMMVSALLEIYLYLQLPGLSSSAQNTLLAQSEAHAKLFNSSIMIERTCASADLAGNSTTIDVLSVCEKRILSLRLLLERKRSLPDVSWWTRIWMPSVLHAFSCGRDVLLPLKHQEELDSLPPDVFEWMRAHQELPTNLEEISSGRFTPEHKQFPDYMMLLQAWSLTKSYLLSPQKLKSEESTWTDRDLSMYVPFLAHILDTPYMDLKKMRVSSVFYSGPAIWNVFHMIAQAISELDTEAQPHILQSFQKFFIAFQYQHPCPICRWHFLSKVSNNDFRASSLQESEARLYPLEWILQGVQVESCDWRGNYSFCLDCKLSCIDNGKNLALFFWKLHNAVSSSIPVKKDCFMCESHDRVNNPEIRCGVWPWSKRFQYISDECANTPFNVRRWRKWDEMRNNKQMRDILKQLQHYDTAEFKAWRTVGYPPSRKTLQDAVDITKTLEELLWDSQVLEEVYGFGADGDWFDLSKFHWLSLLLTTDEMCMEDEVELTDWPRWFTQLHELPLDDVWGVD